MTESRKLIVLRDKLICRRRAIVDSFQAAVTELLTGDDITRIQDAIDAVDRAIADEILAEYSKDAGGTATVTPTAAGTFNYKMSCSGGRIARAPRKPRRSRSDSDR
jgi:hypothetical protein